MTGATVVRVKGTVATRSDATGYLVLPGDAVLIERTTPRWFLLLCPCGCGEEFPINLDPRAGPAWRLYGTAETGLSLFPSVLRETGCRSHYIIWRGRIYLFNRQEDDFESGVPPHGTALLDEAVAARLPRKGLLPFSELADSLDADPWDVLRTCRRLVRTGTVREGKGKRRMWFGRSRV